MHWVAAHSLTFEVSTAHSRQESLRANPLPTATELPTDQWVRIHVHDGDLLVLPAGIYHRFTLDNKESVKMMRLFKVSQVVLILISDVEAS